MPSPCRARSPGDRAPRPPSVRIAQPGRQLGSQIALGRSLCPAALVIHERRHLRDQDGRNRMVKNFVKGIIA
ncbi:MAG: hypothetical protein KBD62_30320, partial [Kofleriaceae bacterium]|nr:hypothetical protein [Kofleriaceae bacterium]